MQQSVLKPCDLMDFSKTMWSLASIMQEGTPEVGPPCAADAATTGLPTTCGGSDRQEAPFSSNVGRSDMRAKCLSEVCVCQLSIGIIMCPLGAFFTIYYARADWQIRQQLFRAPLR